MKITFTIFLFLIAFFAKAQNYLPFPTQSARWVNSFSVWNFQQNPQLVLQYASNFCTDGDTLINGQNYAKIDYCPENAYHAAIRDDNGKVWIVPRDSTIEFILYDFTANVGDTILDLYCEFSSDNPNYVQPWITELVITEVDTLILDGVPRRRLNNVWIEGIGNRQGLFLEPWPNVSQYSVNLECHSVNGAQVYPNAAPNECPMNLSLENHTNDLSIFPNPVNDHMQIKSDQTIEAILIFNQLGELMNVDYSNLEDVNLQQLQPGFYYLQWKNSSGKFSKSFVKM